MAKKLEFDAIMNIDDALKSLEGLEKKAEQSFKRIQSLSSKQSQKEQEAAQLRLRAEDSKTQQRHYKQLAQQTSGTQRKTYQNEANLWAEDARAASAGAKEAEKAAAAANKEVEKEIAQYNQLGEAIRTCRDRIAELANAEAQSSADTRNAEIQARKDAITDVMKRMAVGTGNGVSKVFEGIASSVQKLGTTALNVARTGLSALWNGLKKVASTAVNVARTIGGAVISGIKKLGSAVGNAAKNLLGFNKRHRDFGGSLKHGFMTVLKYAFGIRSLYFLFRRLRTALIDSIKTFAQHDSATMTSLNRLSAAVNTMKYSWGAAFAPVINAVAPILERLINLCTRAANALGALFAALTGGKTFKVATAGASNLAKSTGQAAKNAKELKTQLAGFDELEVLSDDKNSDSGSGSGGGVSYEDMELPDWAKKIKDMIDNAQWEELADMLTSKLNDLVNSVDWAGIGDKIGYWMNGALTFLARAITGFDWYNLGAKLAEMLNHVMYGVEWENLGKILVAKLYIMLRSVAGFLRNFDWDYFTRSVYDVIRGAILGIDWVQVNADFVDGLSDLFGGIADGLDNIEWKDFANQLTIRMQRAAEEIDWDSLGYSISDFLHAAITSATEFLQNIEPTVMGNNIRQFLYGVFGRIDWHTLGEDFLGFLTTMIDDASSLLNSLGFGQMASDLSTMLADMLSLVQWGELSSSFSNFLHNALTNATQFLKNLDGKQIGEGIKSFITNVIEGIDFGQLASDIADLIIAFCDTASDMIATVDDYRKIGDNLWQLFSNAVKSVDWASVAESAFKLLGQGIGAAVAVISQFIYDAVASIFEFFRQFVTDRNGDGKITGGEILAGILEGIIEGVKNIADWIYEHIWKPFWNGLKSVFGIHSPAETMKESGQMIGEGILEGVKGVFSAIGDWIREHIFDPIINGAKEGINAIKETFSGIGETVSGAIDTGKELVSAAWDGLTGIFKDKKPDVYPTEEAILFKEASDALNESLSNSQNASFNAQEAYDKLNATVEALKGKTSLTKEEMDLLLQSESMLAEITRQYGDELERQGNVVDKNAKSVQDAAKAVGDEAEAVTTASRETQNLNQAVNDSNTAYQNASTQASQYGTDMETASSKSESSASRVDTSAKKIEKSMSESASNTTDKVTSSWDAIESRTFEFAESMENAVSGIINTMNVFANNLTMVLAQCVNSVVEACDQMARAWNTDWGTPHFHMPVFSMSGVFDLQTGQTPQVYISGWQWMARGGIVDKATLIGAGEDGREAIVPLERNTEWIDMVANGLLDRLSTSKYANRLAESFASMPLPAMAGGSIVPPNALTGSYGGSLGDSLMEEIRALRSEISALASQPIELSTTVAVDKREIGRAVTQYQRDEARSRG